MRSGVASCPRITVAASPGMRETRRNASPESTGYRDRDRDPVHDQAAHVGPSSVRCVIVICRGCRGGVSGCAQRRCEGGADHDGARVGFPDRVASRGIAPDPPWLPWCASLPHRLRRPEPPMRGRTRRLADSSARARWRRASSCRRAWPSRDAGCQPSPPRGQPRGGYRLLHRPPWRLRAALRRGGCRCWKAQSQRSSRQRARRMATGSAASPSRRLRSAAAIRRAVLPRSPSPCSESSRVNSSAFCSRESAAALSRAGERGHDCWKNGVRAGASMSCRSSSSRTRMLSEAPAISREVTYSPTYVR